MRPIQLKTLAAWAWLAGEVARKAARERGSRGMILGVSVTGLLARARDDMSAPTEHNRRVIGFQWQRLIVRFDRRHIDKRARPVLSSGDLSSGDQSRQCAAADGKKRGGFAW